MGQLRVAIFVVGCSKPTFTQIDHKLDSMQALVGGSIEAVTMSNYTGNSIGEGLVLVCNEEGKLEGLPFVRSVPGDTINGSFFVTRQNEGDEDFSDLTPEDEELLSKWTPRLIWGSFQ